VKLIYIYQKIYIDTAKSALSEEKALFKLCLSRLAVIGY
jgi:hypothetical protein